MKLIYLLITLAILASCSNVKVEEINKTDHAVRIKEEFADLYNYIPSKDSLSQITDNDTIQRNGLVLRGEVIKLVKNYYQDSTGDVEILKSHVLFIDSLAKNKYVPEIIKTEHIDYSHNLALGKDSSFFEVYHDGEDFNEMTAVPVEINRKSTPPPSEIPDPPPVMDCPCEQVDIELSCVQRNYKAYWVGLNGSMLLRESEDVGRNAGYEIKAAYYLDKYKTWSIGLNYVSNYKVQQSLTNELYNVQNLLLFSKKELKPWFCIRPYFFGEFGAAIDEASLDLFRLNCADCKRNLEGGDADLSIPISFGLGTGVNLPLTSWLDLDINIAYRSLSYGDFQNYFGFRTPTRRRLNGVFFGIGLNY